MTGGISLSVLRAKRSLEGCYLGITSPLRRFPILDRRLRATRRRIRGFLYGYLQLGNEYNTGAAAADCPFPFNEMVVNCDGTVACGTVGEAPIVGDVSRQNLWETWDGEQIGRIRRAMLEGSSSSCGQCALHAMELHLNPKYGRRVKMGRRIEKLIIEPTVLCNLDCPTSCGRDAPKNVSVSAKRRTKAMSPALYRKIIDEADNRIDDIGLFNYGEPFLHPDIIEMMTYAKQRCPDASLFVNTNGTLLTDDAKLEGVVSSGLDEILFSVDGAHQCSYERYRKGGCLEEILTSMERLISLRNGKTPRVIWQYILFRWNDTDEELREAERLATEIGVDQFVFQLSAIPFIGSSRFRCGSREFDHIAPFLYESRRFIHAHEMRFETLNEGRIRIAIKNVGNIRWNSKTTPWGRFICIQLFRISRTHQEETLHVERFSKDVSPGESYTTELCLKPEWFEDDYGNTIYADCVIQADCRFRDRDNAPLAIERRLVQLGSRSGRLATCHPAQA